MQSCRIHKFNIPMPETLFVLQKWTTGESTGQQAAEYTQGSWRAVPIISCINGIVNLKVRNTNVPYPDGEEIPVG